MRHSIKPDLRADYKIRLYTGPKTPFFEVSRFLRHARGLCFSTLSFGTAPRTDPFHRTFKSAGPDENDLEQEGLCI